MRCTCKCRRYWIRKVPYGKGPNPSELLWTVFYHDRHGEFIPVCWAKEWKDAVRYVREILYVKKIKVEKR